MPLSNYSNATFLRKRINSNSYTNIGTFKAHNLFSIFSDGSRGGFSFDKKQKKSSPAKVKGQKRHEQLLSCSITHIYTNTLSQFVAIFTVHDQLSLIWACTFGIGKPLQLLYPPQNSVSFSHST